MTGPPRYGRPERISGQEHVNFKKKKNGWLDGWIQFQLDHLYVSAVYV